MLATKSFMQLHQIMNAAQQILIDGSCRVEPPVNLISRFGNLTYEQQEAVSSDLLSVEQSLASSAHARAVQADVTSLVLELSESQPPRDFASQKIVSDFLSAVKRVSDFVDKPLQDKELKWCSRPTVQGCGLDCSQSHSGDGNCLVCGHGWGPHNGHTCARAPFAGRRGSWVSSLRVAPPASVHMDASPGTIKVSLDPKNCEMEGIQSESSLESDLDREVGTVITFNIIHNSATAPKIIVGLSSTPPPLMAPVAANISLGLDLGNLKFIGIEKGKDSDGVKLAGQLKKALSISPSVIK
jgi:hypothetical protein